jgi:hypothetical protein
MEYAPSTGRRWHWSSDRSSIQVVAPRGVSVELSLQGESSLRYFDAPSRVRVLAGDVLLREFTADKDFSEHIAVSTDALQRAQGSLIIETNQSFVQHDRTGNGDRRKLGLRIFDARVVTLR